MKLATLKLSLLTLLISFISLSFIYVANNIDKDKLCKTWYVISGELTEDGETEKLPEDMINSRFIFKKDNSFMLFEPEDENSEKGTWKDIDGKLYINIDNDPMTFTIETLTDTKLVIMLSEDDRQASMTLSSTKKV